MRPLIIGDAAKAKVQRVLDFALQPENWYQPSRGNDQAVTPPGDDKRHVVTLDTYRCAFSIIVDAKEMPWRHLSISVPSEKYPNPFAAYTIAELFGLSGWDGKSVEPPNGWALSVNAEEHCVVLAQPYVA